MYIVVHTERETERERQTLRKARKSAKGEALLCAYPDFIHESLLQ